MEPIAIIGGGWAGLTAAVELTARGRRVVLFEAAKQLGGRARSVPWNGIHVDNGQHLLIGAYRQTLETMQRLGSAQLLERRPLQLRLPGFSLRLPRLPAPWHMALGVLGARGISWKEKRDAARFMTDLQRTGFRLEHDLTAADLLLRHDQSHRLVDLLWSPICVAALNTPLQSASAQVFCNVLRDSLAGTRQASDLLLTRGDLSGLLPDPAAAFITARGGEIRLACKVGPIRRHNGGYQLTGPGAVFREVVVATHPVRLADLLAELPEAAAILAQTSDYAWQPILTLWLRFASPLPHGFPMEGLGGGQSPWVFERNDLAPGLVAVVFSARGAHLERPSADLREDVLSLMTDYFGPLPPLLAWTSITERRATYACVPGMNRPDNRTPLPGLYLAGDYTRGDYPATLEGAVRSGRACADLILHSHRTR